MNWMSAMNARFEMSTLFLESIGEFARFCRSCYAPGEIQFPSTFG